MRTVRRLVILIFVVSIGIFGYAKVSGYLGRKPAVPVITSTVDAIEIPCNYTNAQITKGLAATSEKDGDITDKIMIGSISRFKSKGVATVTYLVFDSYNQSASYTRDVTFTDYESPHFYLSKPLVFEAGTGTREIDVYIGATDVFDGDISNAVRHTTTDLTYNSAGEYKAEVEVMNSFGDVVETALPLHVVDPIDAGIQFSFSENIIYLNKGDAAPNPKDYLENVRIKNGLFLDNSIVTYDASDVDMQKEGVYEIKYSAAAQSRRGVSWLIVVVE